MRAFLQVLGGDLFCKLFWGIANLALIRCLADHEFAQLTVVTAAFTVVFSGWFQNLYQLAIVGRQETALAHRQSSFLSLAFAPAPLLVFLAFPAAEYDPALALPLIVWSALAGLVEYCRLQYRLELQFARFTATEVVKTVAFCLMVSPWLSGWLDGLTAVMVLWFQAIATGLSLAAGGLKRCWFSASLADVQSLVGDLLMGPIRYVLGYSLVLAMMLRLDLFLLEHLATRRDVAIYGAAFRLLGFLGMALNAIHTIALPTLQQAKTSDELRTAFGRQLWIGAAFQPLLMIAILSAGLWFPWTDGGRYPEAINVFRVLASGLSIGIFCSPAINLLFRLRDYQFLFRLVAVLLVISGPLIGGLITTELGVLGAAMGATISVACLNMSIAWRAWKLLTGEEAVIHVIPALDNAARSAA